MRILQVITSMHIGGAEKLITEIAPLLQAKGHQVEVLLFDGTNTSFKKELKKADIRILEFSYGGPVYNPLYIFRLIPLLRKYDIIHTHNTAPQLFSALAGALCSAVLVTTEHNTSNRRREWKWYRLIDRWMYNRYRSVICISDAAEVNLKKYLGGVHTHIVTIYNGINIHRFMEALPDEKLMCQKADRKVMVMVAGFRYQKDQDTLIRAMKYLPKEKYEIWLVGDGERRTFLEQLCRDEQIENQVRFLGIRNNIPEILKVADFVVMSSHFEGLSLSSIEGMAVGKPFIASDVDGLREITCGAGILFPHGDAQQLAREIEHLAENRNYYNQVAKRCLERAEEYDIYKMVDGYERIYKKLFK